MIRNLKVLKRFAPIVPMTGKPFSGAPVEKKFRILGL